VYHHPKKGYGGIQALYRQVQKHQISEITLAQVESGSKKKIPIRYINPYGGNLNGIGPKSPISMKNGIYI
jgi:hypothetical protein